MNRFLKATTAVLLMSGVLTSIGCMNCSRPSLQDRWDGHVDPCWPERYTHTARQQTLAPFAAQVNNGEILDHTLFNYHFETGSEKLNSSGLEKLDYLARRRPTPPSRIYLQTSRDLAYDVNMPEKLVSARQELDNKRTQAVHRYLAVSNAARQLNFEIQVTDPADTAMKADGPATAARGYSTRFQSGLTGTGGSLTGAGGGQSGGSTAGASSPGSSPR